jgi:hypothetical protein
MRAQQQLHTFPRYRSIPLNAETIARCGCKSIQKINATAGEGGTSIFELRIEKQNRKRL